MEEFISANNGSLGTGERSARETKEKIQQNINWMEQHHESVTKWIHENSFANCAVANPNLVVAAVLVIFSRVLAV